MSGSDQRGRAVYICIKKILNIMRDRDVHRQIEEVLLKVDPASMLETKLEKSIPKWYFNLIVALTELYDTAHAAALHDLDKLK